MFFIVPHDSSLFLFIVHHCLKFDSKNLDRLHEPAPHYFNSYESSLISTVFDRIGYSLVDRRIHNLLIIVFKAINNYPPEVEGWHEKPEKSLRAASTET